MARRSAAVVKAEAGGELAALPPRFSQWFERRGWAPRRHQLAMLEKARQGRDALLIAPTGGGKTLAGFLPSLIELCERGPANDPAGHGIHTLYISPLKALAVDSGMPVVRDRPDLEFQRASDEHGILRLANPDAPLGVGDRLWLIPGHCDPTINLYDWYVGVRGDRVEALWPITARGAVW